MNYFSLYLKGLICFCLLFITMDSHALSIDKGYRQNKIKDLALIYQGGVHRIDWTSDQFLPYVVHQFADGHKDWYTEVTIKSARGTAPLTAQQPAKGKVLKAE